MYLEFLGLKGPPFRENPDDCYFMNKVHQAFLDQIEKFDKPLLIVLGEAGIGKTGLARKLGGVYVDSKETVPERIMEQIAVIGGFSSFKEMIETPEKGFRKNQKTIIIDSAEFLDIQALQDVLRMSVTRKERIILFATSGLMKKLKHPDLRSLKEKADYLFFPRLSKEDGIGYIHYRVWYYKEAAEYSRLFDEVAAEYLMKKGKGNPLRINKLADRALRQAAEEGIRHVKLSQARRAFWKNKSWKPTPMQIVLGSSIILNIFLLIRLAL